MLKTKPKDSVLHSTLTFNSIRIISKERDRSNQLFPAVPSLELCHPGAVSRQLLKHRHPGADSSSGTRGITCCSSRRGFQRSSTSHPPNPSPQHCPTPSWRGASTNPASEGAPGKWGGPVGTNPVPISHPRYPSLSCQCNTGMHL